MNKFKSKASLIWISKCHKAFKRQQGLYLAFITEFAQAKYNTNLLVAYNIEQLYQIHGACSQMMCYWVSYDFNILVFFFLFWTFKKCYVRLYKLNVMCNVNAGVIFYHGHHVNLAC